MLSCHENHECINLANPIETPNTKMFDTQVNLWYIIIIVYLERRQSQNAANKLRELR